MDRRLTFRLGESNPSYGLEDKSSAKPGLFTDYDGFYAFLLATHKLGQYEDTGLTPAEVAELAQAKADGRVVVLPCKRGDMVYFIGINYTKCSAYGTEYDEVCCAGCEEPCDSEKTRNVYMTQAEDTRWILRRLNDFGRIYFITREEAEKALRESDNNAID
ncbi:MAG TPA: hypothetical protein DEP23_17400 [Ruminococcaceae bacterium]|nr:hypothetical protein [Oscillospiraceae bacterium]